MKITLCTLALAAALVPSVLAGRGIDNSVGAESFGNKTRSSTKPSHGDKSGKITALGRARW